MNRLHVEYELACMATPKDKYYIKLLKSVIEHNDHQNVALSNDNLRQAIIKVVAETEDEDFEAKRNANNATMGNLSQSPVTTNTQGNIENVPNERQITSDILS